MPSSESTAGAGDSPKIFGALNEFVSPQGEEIGPSVFSRIIETTRTDFDALMKTGATLIDIPLGVSSAVAAGIINTPGIISRVGNATISRPMAKVRKAIYDTVSFDQAA